MGQTSRRGFRSLNVYQLSLQTAVQVHVMTRGFPKIEQYAMIDQMRRASRSVCANIADIVVQKAIQSCIYRKNR